MTLFPMAPVQRSRCIILDPPWSSQDGGCGHGAQNHYPLQTTPQIIETVRGARWPDGSTVYNPDENAHVWIWYTRDCTTEMLRLMSALRARLVSERVWIKTIDDGEDEDGNLRVRVPTRRSLGQYSRGVHEPVALGVIGSLLPATDVRFDSAFFAPRGRHSSKPDVFYSQALRMAGVTEGVEIYARPPRPGFRCWGDEIEGCYAVGDQTQLIT